MNCQMCGIEAATKHIELRQNIGAIFLRFPRTLRGQLCKSCIHKSFWKMTLINLFLGWWGIISMCVTPIFIIMNIVRYVPCLGMPPAPQRRPAAPH